VQLEVDNFHLGFGCGTDCAGLLVLVEVLDLAFCDQFMTIKDTFFSNFTFLIKFDQLSKGFIVFKVSKHTQTVVSMDLPANAILLAIFYFSLCHGHDPVIIFRLFQSWVSIFVCTIYETSKFDNSSVSSESWCDLIIQQEFVLIWIDHLFGPVIELELAKVTQALDS
jgi:hypothetical protein